MWRLLFLTSILLWLMSLIFAVKDEMENYWIILSVLGAIDCIVLTFYPKKIFFFFNFLSVIIPAKIFYENSVLIVKGYEFLRPVEANLFIAALIIGCIYSNYSVIKNKDLNS